MLFQQLLFHELHIFRILFLFRYNQIRKKSSNFLILNDSSNCLESLRFNSKTMLEPEITIICSHYEMAVAKQLAFSLGKRIYSNFASLQCIYELLRVKKTWCRIIQNLQNFMQINIVTIKKSCRLQIKLLNFDYSNKENLF